MIAGTAWPEVSAASPPTLNAIEARSGAAQQTAHAAIKPRTTLAVFMYYPTIRMTVQGL